ncbi:MAG: N-acetylmuramoyl-L-alanine amidase, partial [Chloroflexota bacterium]
MAVRRRLAGTIAAITLAGSLAVGLPAGAAPAAAALPLAGIVIAVDPGHNGGNASHPAIINRLVWSGIARKACNTVGTSTLSGYPEHRFNFDVAVRLKARLEALGATVYLTRSSDTGVGPCVDVRGRFGARVHADLMVSIHGNGAPSGDRGFFVMRPGLVAGYTDDILTRSAALARAVRAGLVSAGLAVANYYAVNGIVARRDLGTLSWSDVPVVMVELGNMHTAGDALRMRSATGRDRYAA